MEVTYNNRPRGVVVGTLSHLLCFGRSNAACINKNLKKTVNMKRKKLLIDVNDVVSYDIFGKENGIGRTTRELIQALDKVGSLPFDIELFSQNIKGVGG